MITTVLQVLAALAPAIAALIIWWVKSRPEAKAKARRKANEEIADNIINGDAGYVNRLLNKLRKQQ